MEFYTLDDVANDIQRKNTVANNKNISWFTEGVKKLDNLLQNPTTGGISDISYTTGFDNVYEKGMDGRYYMKYENYLGSTGNEDRLGKQQSGWEQAWNGLTKNVAKVGLYATDAIVGTVYGIGSAIKDGDMRSLWDNDVSNALDYASKYLDRELPNYYTDEQKSNNFLQNLGTFNFWANDFMNGMAFVAGAVLPQLVLAPLTGGASVAPSLARAGASIGIKTARNAGKTALRETLRAGRTGAKIGNVLGEGLNSAKFMVQSATFEAGMEARHNFHDSIENWTKDYIERNGAIPTTEETQRFINIAEKASNGIFYGNMALLSVTNATMFGKAFGLGKVEMPKASQFKKMLGVGYETTEGGVLKALEPTKLQKALGKTYYMGQKPFSEGIVEEGLQGVMGKMATTYTDAKYEGDDSYSFFQNLTSSLQEQYGTREGWNEIGVGMLVGMFGQNVSGNIGIAGLAGRNSGTYNQNLQEMSSLINNANTQRDKYIQNFRSINGTNSMFNSSQKEDDLQNTQIFQDSVINLNYIKDNVKLKGISDTIADYDAMVDTLDISESQLVLADISSIDEYKSQMKSQFREDVNMFTSVDRFIANLGVENIETTKGNQVELADALRTSFVIGEKSEIESKKIATNIEAMTGIGGVSSALKFFSELDGAMERNIEKRDQQTANLQELETAIVNIQSDIQIAQADGNKEKVRQLQKKYVVTANKIEQLNNQISLIDSRLNQRFDAIKASDLDLRNSYDNIDDVLATMRNLKNYSNALKQAGRKREALELDNSIEQFNVFSQTSLDTKLAFDAMTNSNYFKGGEGKKLFSSIVGKDYEPNSEALKEIKEIEGLIIEKAQEFGYSVNSSEQFFNDVVKNSQDLSEREKSKVEAIARILATQKMIESRLDMASENFSNSIESEIEAQEQIVEVDAPQVNTDSPNIIGDTVVFARRLANNNPTTTEQLKAVVDEIANLSNQILNKPTSDRLREVSEKRQRIQELEELKTQLLNDLDYAVQKFETNAVLQRQQEETRETGSERRRVEQSLERQENSQESQEEIITTPTGQIIIDFPSEELQIIVDDIIENIDGENETENLLSEIINYERTSEFGDVELADRYEDILNRFRNGKINLNEIGEVLNQSANRENQGITQGETGNPFVETPSDEQVSQVDEQLRQETQERIEEIDSEIEVLEDEIYELERPFKFEETEDYKEYSKLLSKPEKTEDELIRLEELRSDINNWIFIMGTEVEGLDFAGLVEQMVSIENQITSEIPNTEELSEEAIEINFNSINKSNNQNLTTGLNFNSVTSVIKKRKDGSTYTSISNISLEDLEDESGITNLVERGVELNEETNSLILDNEIVREINTQGNLYISTPEQSSGTYYSPIRKRAITLSGEVSYIPLESRFNTESEDSTIVDENVYNVGQGEVVSVKFDPFDEYNQQLLNEVKNELGYRTKAEIEAEVEEELKTYKPEKLIKEQIRLRDLIVRGDKVRIKTQEDKVQNILDFQRDKIRKQLENSRKNELSTELKSKLISKLKLTIVDRGDNNLQILKGSRTVNDSEKIDLEKLETIRAEIVDNIDNLIEAIETPFVKTIPSKIKVKKVLVGFPNYRYTDNTDGIPVKVQKIFSKEDLQNVHDTGYIENGKITTRIGLQKIDTTFVNKQVESGQSSKIPIVVIKMGEQNIAYPVNVGQYAPPVTESDMRAVFNNESITNKEKAMRLNELLSLAGIDTNVAGNAFISVRESEKISEDFFNDKLAQMNSIVYLRSVDMFADKSLNIDQILIGGVSINLNMSKPFFSPKIKFDFSSIEVKEVSDESKRKESKKVVTDSSSSPIATELGNFRC